MTRHFRDEEVGTWSRPWSNVPVLRLGTTEFRNLLSRVFEEAEPVLDEWDSQIVQTVPTERLQT
jgi:hypothetical protein